MKRIALAWVLGSAIVISVAIGAGQREIGNRNPREIHDLSADFGGDYWLGPYRLTKDGCQLLDIGSLGPWEGREKRPFGLRGEGDVSKNQSAEHDQPRGSLDITVPSDRTHIEDCERRS